MTSPTGDRPSFGTLLRKYRKEKDLTQETLAELVLVTPQTISNYERDKTQHIDRDIIVALARALVQQDEKIKVQVKKANDLLTSCNYAQLTRNEIRDIFGEEDFSPDNSEKLADNHHYIRMLVVLPAPVADQSGKGPPNRHTRNIWKEWQRIRQGIERGRNVVKGTNAPWVVVRLVPPTIDEFRDMLTFYTPGYQVIHISCYGSRDGLWLEDQLGREQLVSNLQLVDMLAGTGARLVVLNAGEALALGQTLVEHAGIPCVIATKQPLDNREASVLSEKLYHHLALGATSGEALEEVRRSIVDQNQTGDLSVTSDSQPYSHNLVLIGDEQLRLQTHSLDASEPLFILDPTPHNELPLNLLTGFVGRNTQLQILANWFVYGDSCIFAITGVGGLGKTSLALNAALRNAYRFRALIFTSAYETFDFGTREVLQQINNVLHLTSTPDEAEYPINALAQRLNTHAILLILDNLESLSPKHTSELAQVLKNLDPRGPSRVLMTLRPNEQGELTSVVRGNRINLPVLDSMDALRLAWEETVRWQTQLTPQNYDRSLLPDLAELKNQARDTYLKSLNLEELALLDELISLAFYHPKLIQLAVSTLDRYGWTNTRQLLERLHGKEIEEALEDYIGQVLNNLIQHAPESLNILHAMLVFAGGAEASRLCTVFRGRETAQNSIEMIDFEEQHLRPIVKTNLLRHENQRYDLDPPVRGYLESKRSAAVAIQTIYHYRHAETFLALIVNYNTALQEARMTYTQPMEWSNITAALRWLTLTAHNDNQIAHLLLSYIHYGRTFIVYNFDSRSLQWLNAAQKVAKQLNDHRSQAEILVGIGRIQFYHSKYEQALASYNAALTLCQTINEDQIKADAHRGIGEIHRMLNDDNDTALSNYNAALALYSGLGNRKGKASSLWGIGWLHQLVGKYETALANFNAALALSQEINDLAGEADALSGLGEIQLVRRELDAAMTNWSRTLTLYQAAGDRLGEAETLWGIGDVQRLRGEYKAALMSYDASLKAHQEIGLESSVPHIGIGDVYRLQGKYDAAIASYTTALTICRKDKDYLYEAKVLWGIGEIQRLLGEYNAASTSYHTALKLYRVVNTPLGEANVLASQSQLALVHNNRTEASHLLTQAIDIYRELGDHYSIAEKLSQYGKILLSIGDFKQAHSYLGQAASLFAELGFDDDLPHHQPDL